MDIGMIMLSVFCLTFILAFSVIYRMGESERKKERNLDLIAINSSRDDDLELEKEKKSKLYKIYEEYYNTKFLQANLRITFAEFKTYVFSIGIVTLILTITLTVIFSPIFALMFGGFVAFILKKLPEFVIDNKKYKRKLAINAQKSDILSIMQSCSQSQMPLDKTFKVLSERLKAPVNEIFYEAFSLMRVGNSAEDVLKHLKKVFDSNDFDFLLSSYEVWLENQGSLQDTYKIVSITVRDKEEIDLHMSGLASKSKSALIMLVAVSMLFVGLSLFMIPHIFIPFMKSLTGQIAIVVSLFVFAWGVNQINNLKNSVKY